MKTSTIISLSVGGFLAFIVLWAAVGPQYGVYEKTLSGKAQLQEAEFTRQVAVLEAQAKKDSAQQLADAEIIRAQGVAKANAIIGDSLRGNPAYLQYLWITQGEGKTDRTVYMVPSGGGAPVPTFDIQEHGNTHSQPTQK